MNLLTFSQDNPLLFTQSLFWVFFAVVLMFYSPLRNKLRARHFYLLVVSFLFYYLSSGLFVFLLFVTTVLTYAFGRLLFRLKSTKARKTSLVFGIVVNLFFLCYFKYAYFIIDIING
ncbi:MAG: MBOAT family protein, partial [Bacteroidales bacterium]|nr:MBOAT family protein [Bacteroidales bacterium]